MAIQRTNITEPSGGSLSVTFNHTNSAYYSFLLVSFYFQDDDNTPETLTVTCDGTPMTLATSQSTGGSPLRGYFTYYIVGNAFGTNSISISAPTGSFSGIKAISYKNVNQLSPINTIIAGTDSGGVDSWNPTTTADDCWIFSYLGFIGAVPSYTGGTNCVIIGTNGSIVAADSNGSVGAAGVKTVTATAGSASSWAWQSVAFAPAITIPILDTTTYDNLAQTSVRALSGVLYDGDATVTERGFVYNTSATPTTSNSKKIVAGTVGSYTADITGLSVNTTYYVRAYAINANGTAYSNEITFTTLNIPQYELQKDIGATDGETFIGQINVTGTVGTITVKLGSTGTSTVIAAGSGPTTFSGTYSGLSGLIITRSATFNGTIDDVFYAQVPLGTTIDFSLDAVTIITAIDGSVFFKRIEEKVFNSFAFYRYLDVLFKDLDGFVTVTVRSEREDDSTEISKTFSVGNPNSGTVSPFQKKRISFLIKDQAVIIGFSNANIGETFSLAQFLLTGYKKPEKLFSPGKIISMS